MTREELAREKARLPRGWGRFGKSIDELGELAEDGEELVSTCVGLNPSFEHRSITLGGALNELTKATNLVLALTDRRLLLVAAGFGGGAHSNSSIALEGLEVVASSKRELTVRWPDGEMKVKGIAKQMLPGFLEALQARLA